MRSVYVWYNNKQTSRNVVRISTVPFTDFVRVSVCHKPSRHGEKLTNAFVGSCRSSPSPRSVVVERSASLAVRADCIVSTLATERSVACRHTTACRVPVAFAATADRQVRQRVETTVFAGFINTPTINQLEMWANGQRDGRPAEYRWRPLFNAAKFGCRPLLECSAVTLPRRETR